MKSIRPESSVRVNTLLEAFLAQQLKIDNVEFYEQESCIQDNEKNKFFNKFTFRILIVCNDRIYLTDNPPKHLENFVRFEDIIEIKMVSFLLFHAHQNLKLFMLSSDLI